MARSKAPLFEEDEQMASKLCYGMAHPARIRMISRLITGNSITYSNLIAGIPLDDATCMQHINILRRLSLIEPALLHTKKGGYRLNTTFYRDCTLASRRLLRVEGAVRRLEGEVEEDVG